MSMTPLKYRVGTFRDAGLEARWVKSRKGRPYIVVRDKKIAQAWLTVGQSLFDEMQIKGIKDAYFSRACMLDLFSIPAE